MDTPYACIGVIHNIMENLNNGAEQPKFVPKPAESFEVEFLTVKNEAIKDAMLEIGEFVFRRSESADEDSSVYFEGERGDGTKIKITIEKGEHYKSPAEIEEKYEQS